MMPPAPASISGSSIQVRDCHSGRRLPRSLKQNRNLGVAKLVFHLEQVAQPLRLAVLLSPDAGMCATAELPLALRRPLSDWSNPVHG
jgi:hypothetical protein